MGHLKKQFFFPSFAALHRNVATCLDDILPYLGRQMCGYAYVLL